MREQLSRVRFLEYIKNETLVKSKSKNLINFKICGSGSVVERCLAKANVASSNLVFRSTKT